MKMVRAKHALALAVSLGALAAMATTSGAEYDCFLSGADASACKGRITFDAAGEVKPKALPRHEMAPVAVEAHGEIKYEDGSRPPNLREVVFNLDRDVRLDPTAYPVCEDIRGHGYSIRLDLRAECPESIVGRGTAKVAFVFSDLPPAEVPLTFFNGGVFGGFTGLMVQTEVLGIRFQTGVTIERARKGLYGHTATWAPRVIAGGDAVLTKFDFRLKRGYVRARCTDGKLQANITKALFKEEGQASGPTTTLKGTAITPCTPRP